MNNTFTEDRGSLSPPMPVVASAAAGCGLEERPMSRSRIRALRRSHSSGRRHCRGPVRRTRWRKSLELGRDAAPHPGCIRRGPSGSGENSCFVVDLLDVRPVCVAASSEVTARRPSGWVSVGSADPGGPGHQDVHRKAGQAQRGSKVRLAGSFRFRSAGCTLSQVAQAVVTRHGAHRPRNTASRGDDPFVGDKPKGATGGSPTAMSARRNGLVDGSRP